MSEPIRYRIKIGKRIFRCELDALLDLISAGKVGRDTPVVPPFSEKWLKASELRELKDWLPEVDPWAAWDEVSDDDIPTKLELDHSAQDTAFEPMVTSEVPVSSLSDEAPARPDLEDLPAAAIHPVSQPPSLPSSSVKPLKRRKASPLNPPPSVPTGKIIAFPTSRSPLTDGVHALDTATQMLPVTQRHHPPAQREKRTKSVSMFRLGFLLLLGGMVLMAGHWYVTTTSSATYAPHPSMMATPEPAENNAEGAVSDLYIEMEESIRSRMQVGIIDVAEPGELEEALLIELRRVRVDVTSVRAPVMKWVGRMRDVPQSAEFRIRIRSNGGEFDRELASISMVVGKYIQHYSLDVARFEVVFDLDEGSRSQVIEPELARRLYLQRLALMEFLQQV